MSKIMFQFRHTGSAPSLAQVAQEFGLDPSDLDADFGVIQTDSSQGLYTVQVEEAAAARLSERLKAKGSSSDPAVGVFSNPTIEPI